MRCFECRYLDRSKVLTCYPPKYYCTYDKTTHFADDECKYEHYPIVRCKDCERYGRGSCPRFEDFISNYLKDDDFCPNCGARMKGGDTE